MRRTIASAVAAFAVTASLFAAAPANAAEVDITGSGSSYSNNFIMRCATAYKAKTGSTVNYNPLGSGTGRSDFATGKTDFGGSDVVYSAADTVKPASYVTVPVIGGPIAIVFNVKGVNSMKLDPATISAIFKGTITKWDDPAIKALNPKTTFPSTDINVVYRSKNSGTSQNFQDFLNQTAGGWTVGGAWTGAKDVPVADSAAMATTVKGTSSAIGYVDLSDVGSVKFGKVAVKNAKGEFVKPSAKAASKFLSKQKVNADGSIVMNYGKKIAGAYQVSMVTYMFIPKAGTDKGKAAAAWATYAVEKCSKKPFPGYAGLTGKAYKTALALAKSGN
ncbi:MAG: substrate-binding domain-containing protein [Actinobacteria bacterium]|nr:substrate-binding domain-containing protein [Actinomycetota bacterium]